MPSLTCDLWCLGWGHQGLSGHWGLWDIAVTLTPSPHPHPGKALRCHKCVAPNENECNQQGSQSCPPYSDACSTITAPSESLGWEAGLLGEDWGLQRESGRTVGSWRVPEGLGRARRSRGPAEAEQEVASSRGQESDPLIPLCAGTQELFLLRH